MIKKLEQHFLIVLIIGAIIAMAISLVIGLSQSVWFDEAYSIIIAKQPLSQLIHLTAVDTHPPFYYLLLKTWAGIFGWGEMALRSFSVISLGGAIIAMGLLLKKLFGSRSALMALPFIIFSPFLLRYGFEIRMYSFGALIGVLATYVLVCALESKKRWQYVLYAFLVALGVYTFYYMALLWIAHLVWLIWLSVQNKQSILKSQWIWAYALSVVMFIPWLPAFYNQMANSTLAPVLQSMTFDNLAGIASFGFIFKPAWQLDAIQSLITVFVVSMIGYFGVRGYRLANEKQKQYLALLATFMVVPIAVLTIVGIFRPMYVERYLSHIMIGGLAFIGVTVAFVVNKSGREIKLLAILFASVMLIGVVNLASIGNFNYQRMQTINTKQAAESVNCQNGAVIMAADPYEAIEFSYYLSNCPIYFYSETAHLIGGYTMLSESSLRTVDPLVRFDKAPVIYNISYAEPKYELSSRSGEFVRSTFGKLVVDKYTAL